MPPTAITGGKGRPPSICVFCGSSHGKDPAFTEAARTFGTLLTRAGFDLVFGGGGVGLMGEVAAAVAREGGGILGVIPEFLRHVERPLQVKSQLIVTETMNERKARMFDAADGFAVLPGGLGTIDELAEAYTAAQLHQHAKPIVLVNVKDYFVPWLRLIDHVVDHGFAEPAIRDLVFVAATPEEAIRILAARAVHV